MILYRRFSTISILVMVMAQFTLRPLLNSKISKHRVLSLVDGFSIPNTKSATVASTMILQSKTSNNMIRESKNTGKLIRSFTSLSSSKSDTNQSDIVQDMLYRIRRCNDVPSHIRDTLLSFEVDGITVGKMTLKVANLLCNSSPDPCSPVFKIEHNDNNGSQIITLTSHAGSTFQSRTDSIMSVMKHLHSKGIIKGWRDELYPLSTGFYDEPIALVERAAVNLLGMQQYGVHINGYVEKHQNNDQSEEILMWMARRSKNKSKYPGMLDHIVAGGQPAGLSLIDNVVKECYEEAGIPEDMTRKGLIPCSAISYEVFLPTKAESSSDLIDGVVERAVMFCFDLKLPSSFTPVIVDGEVEEFFTWDVEQVMASMKQDYPDPIKPNCYPVIIDFLVRRGFISPDSPGYLNIVSELRGGYCG